MWGENQAAILKMLSNWSLSLNDTVQQEVISQYLSSWSDRPQPAYLYCYGRVFWPERAQPFYCRYWATLIPTQASSPHLLSEFLPFFVQPLPSLLPNYKNPCWYEKIPAGFRYNQTYYCRNRCPQKAKRPCRTFKDLQDWVDGGAVTSRLRCYPYVYLLGVTKSGTGQLYAYMRKYMEGFVPGKVKESQFWSKRRLGVTFARCDTDHYYGMWIMVCRRYFVFANGDK